MGLDARVPHHIDPTRDAIAVIVLGVGQLEDGLVRDCLEQAKAKDRRCHARRTQDLFAELAVGGGEDHLGVTQDKRGAIAVFARDFVPGQFDAGFGCDTVDGVVLELGAEPWHLERTTVDVLTRE